MSEPTSHSGHRNGGFGSSFGFIIACVGSAVGLGNIWMFPYRLGQYGGAAFLIPYLFFVLLFGWVGLSAEFGIGRLAGTGTIGAYEYCFASRGKKKLGGALSWLPLMGSLGIAIGYAVILGWVLNSLAGFISGQLMSADPAPFFQAAASSFGNPIWHTVVVAVVCLVLIFGVSAGIERVSKVLMPLFFLLFLVLAAWVFTLPGAGEGYRFLFVPHWEQLLRAETWIMAMGQAFFSLSITGSGMIVYGAYLKKDADTQIWNLEKVENEPHKEPPDHVLEAVAKQVSAEQPVWTGSPSELADTVHVGMAANALSKYLNVKSGRLLDEYRVHYENKVRLEGRRITLTYDAESK